MKLKFCGLTRKEDIEAANETKPDFIGFVFAESRRHVSDMDAARLREGAPAGTVFVAESGVSAPADAAALRKTGADAVLVGEYLMRAADKKQALDALREAVK